MRPELQDKSHSTFDHEIQTLDSLFEGNLNDIINYCFTPHYVYDNYSEL